MFLPEFATGRGKSKKMVIDFKGLNLSDNFAEGQMEDCEGISLKEYPSIVPGREIKRAEDSEKVNGIYERGGLVKLENEKVYFKGDYIGDISPTPKVFAGVNTKIVIMPDKKYIDTLKKEIEDLESSLHFSGKFTAGSIEGEGFSEKFTVGDAVLISGSEKEENNKSAIIREIKEKELIFDSDIFTATEEAEELTLERKIPEFEFICESGNRIWGVKENTIYASKLGDPTNFEVYDGLSTDAYAVAVASPGAFTAVTGYGSRILFFKEDCIHVVYGTKPSNYQIYTYNVPGVMKGAEKSLQIIGEVLYYKGRDGVYAYSGGVPRLISEELGSGRYEGGVSGKDGDTYFICLKKENKSTLFSYDTKTGMWLKERDIDIEDFALSDGRLLFTSGKKLYSYCESEEFNEEWSVTLKPFTEYIDERKIYSSIFMRYESEGVIRVFVSCDGGAWDEVKLLWKNGRRLTYIPIFPQRCDSFKIKICGRGKFKIKSISREFSIGGDEN